MVSVALLMRWSLPAEAVASAVPFAGRPQSHQLLKIRAGPARIRTFLELVRRPQAL
jgi:hypothetical protein